MSTLDDARHEIDEVHRLIQAWIRGDLPHTDAAFAPFAARFTDDFTLIGPGGAHTDPGGAVRMVREMYGTNPDFEIWIDEVVLVRETDDIVVARYAEWQRHAIHSRRSFNGRWSTVVFDRTEDGLRWAWLHETWMSDEVLDAVEASAGQPPPGTTPAE